MTSWRRSFDAHYVALTTWGLVIALWFGATENAANDLWAASFLFGWFSILALFFLIGSYRNQNSICLPLVGFVFCFLLHLFISSRFSWDINSSHLETWIWFYSSMAFFLSCSVFQQPQPRIQFQRYGGLILIPLVLICIVEQCIILPYGYSQFHFLGLHLSYGHWEVAGTLVNSIVLAGFVLSWIFILWDQYRKSRHYATPLFCGILILILARSWWSCVSLGVGLLYYYHRDLWRLAHRNKKWVVSGSAAALAFIAFILYFKFGSHQGELYKAGNRWDWWMAAWRMAIQHPWTGIGLGAYATALPYFKPHPGQNTLYVHSFPLQLLAETGFPGFVCMAAIFLTYLFYFRSEKSSEDSFYQERAAQATLISLLFFSTITIFMDYFLSKLILMIFLSLSLGGRKVYSRRLAPLSVAVIALGITLCVFRWNLFLRASQYHVIGLHEVNHGETERAKQSFREALLLNPYQDESDAALAHLYKQSYDHTRSSTDLDEYRMYINQAFLLKKDIHYLSDLKRSYAERSAPLSNH